MSDIYKEYKRTCLANETGTIKPLPRHSFDKIIDEKNISFQPPKKDCDDTCGNVETKYIDELSYNDHITKKKQS